jgi:glycerol-3-phosphate acyltransferase PlsY
VAWQTALPVLGASIAGYLLGSMPTAGWVAGSRGIDPLLAGEGNPGASNVWRLLGPRAGLTVLGADIGKGAAAALIGLFLGGWWAACASVILAMAGHAWPVWSRFRGGRSVACLVGGGLVLSPAAFAVSLLMFAVLIRVFGLWRAAAVGMLAYPLVFGLFALQRWRLIGIGAAYLVLIAAWTSSARRTAAQA